MLPSGAVHLDYSIQCYECEKQLRTIAGVDIAEIHTNSDGEDVCADCCDVCAYTDDGFVGCNPDVHSERWDEQNHQELVGFGA